jgi:glycosyltransferase 2 family protein
VRAETNPLAPGLAPPVPRRAVRGTSALALKLGFGVGLLLFLVHQTDGAEFLAMLRAVDPLVFAAALAVAALGNALRTWKWQVLLAALGARARFNRLHAVTYMALFFNNFLPGALGGDGFRVLRTAQLSGGAGDAAAVVVMDRMTGLIALVLFVCLAAAYDLAQGPLLFPAPVMLQLLVAALIALLACCLAAKLSDRVSLLNRLPLPLPAGKLVAKLAIAFRLLHTHPSMWRGSMYLSCATLLAMVLAMYGYAVAANVPVSLVAVALIVPLASFLILVPISFNGLGLQEGAFVLFFDAVGVAPTQAFALALAPRVSLLVFSLVGGAVYLLERRR